MDTWGQGAVNNRISWGQAPLLNTKVGNWGKICFTSYAGKTSLTGQSSRLVEKEVEAKSDIK